MPDEHIPERWYLLFGGSHGLYTGRALAYERAVAHLQAPPANVVCPAYVAVVTERSYRQCWTVEELHAVIAGVDLLPEGEPPLC